MLVAHPAWAGAFGKPHMPDWVGRSERPDTNGNRCRMTLASLSGEDRTQPDPRRTTIGRSSGSPRGRLATDTRTRLTRVETSEELAIDEMAEATWNLPLGRGSGAGRRGRKRGKHRPSGRRGQTTGPGDRPHDCEGSPPLPVRGRAIVKPPSKGGDAPDEGATAAGYGDTGELTAMSAPFCRWGDPVGAARPRPLIEAHTPTSATPSPTTAATPAATTTRNQPGGRSPARRVMRAPSSRPFRPPAPPF